MLDDEGNYIYADLDICSVTFRLINIYAPNNDTPSFFHNIDKLIVENNLDHSVIGGDFNLVLNPENVTTMSASITQDRDPF